MFRPLLLPLAAALLVACGTDDVGALTGDDVGFPDTGVESDAGVREPEHHRPVATPCDDQRSDRLPDIPDPNPGPPYVQCTTHEECAEGDNGRCVGNSHDGYYCTYDQCFTDGDCAAGLVCQCGGGFRSDHNVCFRSGNCRIDADCGPGGFCSPTYGSCGDYSSFVAYYCHTPQDECLDDSDCGDYPSYCAYDEVAGRWTCQDSHCAG